MNNQAMASMDVSVIGADSRVSNNVSGFVVSGVPVFNGQFSAEFIGEVSYQVAPASPHDSLAAVLKRFQSDKGLHVMPVVEEGRAVGIINRLTFLEENVIGMHGYAYQINQSKPIKQLMQPVPLLLEADTPVRAAARSIQAMGNELRVDNVCITREGLYAGVIDVTKFINAITEINLTLAKGANPLSGLPGNESIQREINERLHQPCGFDIAYVDLDNFKPYNDYYGFQKGDVVIKSLAEIITRVTEQLSRRDAVFCGHIGGDDFIIISAAGTGCAISEKVIEEFRGHLAVFHGEKDFQSGCYTAVNRKGEAETFNLLALSIGIVNTLLTPVSSYAELASLSTEVKKAAKALGGGGIVVNRRGSKS